jgi:hypothetical protein
MVLQEVLNVVLLGFFVLLCFSLLLFKGFSSSTLSSTLHILSSAWSSLLVRLSTEFLIYWAFHFQNLNLLFFRISVFLITFSYLALSSLIHSAVYLYSLLIYLGVYSYPLDFLDHS